MTHSPHPHRPPRSPQLPSRPLRRVIPKEPGPMNQQNHCWLAAYARSADAAARIHWRNRLVEGNLGLVHSVAARFAATSPLPYADLVQVGCQGLIRAVEAFDDRRARCLSTFAIPYVRGAIQHELRDREAWIRPPRRIWELRQKARTFQDARRASGLHPLGQPELAAALGCTPAELDETERLQEVAHPLSLDALQSSSEEVDGAGTWLDQLADPHSVRTLADGETAQPQIEPHRRPQLAWLRQQLNRLDPLQRDLVLARVLVGCSWVELGQQHGLHPRMAERRCSAALRQLRQSAEAWREGREA